MDEFWQRYGAFGKPVAYAVLAFLGGFVVVHIMTPDPVAGQSQNTAKAAAIKRYTAPTPSQIAGAKENAASLKAELLRKSKLVDQRHGDGDGDDQRRGRDEVIVTFVRQALRASHLRGSDPADVTRFDGDAAARDQSVSRYTALEKERSNQLKTQDPNVAFSQLRADVVSELSLRANRGDVDVGSGAEQFGQDSFTSVDGSELVRRLANLALVATVIDVAIREGVRSIDGVAILPPETYGAATGPEPFLAEWPVKIDLTGTPDALTAVVNVLTDSTRPTPLGTTTWKQADRGQSGSGASREERRLRAGIVKAEMKVYSVRVHPEVALGLESEEGE